MTCPYSDGFQCFFTMAQCAGPNVWQASIPVVPGFPPTLGFCLSPMVGSNSYINLSIANRANITESAIIAFVNLKEATMAGPTWWTPSTAELIGIVAGSLGLLIIIACSYTMCKKQKILTNVTGTR